MFFQALFPGGISTSVPLHALCWLKFIPLISQLFLRFRLENVYAHRYFIVVRTFRSNLILFVFRSRILVLDVEENVKRYSEITEI